MTADEPGTGVPSERLPDAATRVETFQRWVADIVDYAIFSLDVDGLITSWNLGAARLKGYEEAEVLGKHFSMFFGQEDIDDDRPQRLLERARREGRAEDTGWRVRRDGSRFWADVVITSVVSDGEVIGFVKITRDMTTAHLNEERERRLNLELERSSRMKSEFLANMSHEVRTPLNGLLGMLHLLEGTELADDQRDLVRTAVASSEALLRIVNDILDLSKVEAGRLTLDEQPFDLGELVGATISFLAPEATANGLTLRHEVAADVPREVVGDAGRLRQVLLNLLGNALKFTHDGGVDVLVRRVGQDGDDDLQTVAIEVRDTGVGIAAADLDRLFRPFEQADVSTARMYGGTGLGLTIARQLVDLMGGKLSVQSAPGVGSSFTVTLPMHKVPGAPPPAPSGAAPVAGSTQDVAAAQGRTAPAGDDRLHDVRVLVVEDNLINQKVTVAMLRRLGVGSIDVVENGELAVEAAAIGAYDLVLMDCQMPVLDGYEATRQIRSLPAPVASVPIVAVTATALPEERVRCRAVGMDDHLSKPISQASLQHVVERFALRGTGRSNGHGSAAPQGVEGDATVEDAPQRRSLRSGLDERFGAEVAEGLVRDFLDIASSQVEELQRCVDVRDADALAKIAHSLKGASATIDAVHLAEAAAKLEARARGTQDFVVLADAVADVEAGLRSTAAQLRSD